jgi:predicted DNA-binding transcriptional regulator AlpA
MSARGLLTRKEVCLRYQIADRTLRLWMQKRGFPRPSRVVTVQRQWWRESILDDFDRRLETAGAGA